MEEDPRWKTLRERTELLQTQAERLKRGELTAEEGREIVVAALQLARVVIGQASVDLLGEKPVHLEH